MYFFKIENTPTKFNEEDFFNSVGFYNYIKKIGIQTQYISINFNEEAIGYLILSKRKFFKFNIYGSPIRGIGADVQGFSFFEKTNRQNINYHSLLISFNEFISKKRITPLRLLDKNISENCLELNDWYTIKSKRYILELNRDFLEIQKGFSYKSAIYEINKAKKRGVEIQIERNIGNFLDIHYKHLEDVFKRKGIPVPHSKKRLQNLFESLNDNQYLLTIAYNNEGIPIASNSYLVGKEMSFFYTAASLTEYLKDSPNEILMSQSIIELQKMGTMKLEFGRGMNYKKKYGPEEVDFLEINSKKGLWKIKLIEFLETRYKKLRKLKIFKLYLNQPINRLMHIQS